MSKHLAVYTDREVTLCVYDVLLHNSQRYFIIFSHPFSFQRGEIGLNEASFLMARFLTPYSPIKFHNDMSNLNEQKRIYYAN